MTFRAFSTIPNSLSLFRAFAGPFVSALLFLQRPWSCLTAFILFVLASLTDYWDGYLARRWRQVSPLGAFLDVLADKLLICLTLVMLVEVRSIAGLHIIPALGIIGRELIMASVRSVPWIERSLQTSFVAKTKTFFQMMAVGLFIGHNLALWFHTWALICLWVSWILSSWSALQYFRVMNQKSSDHTPS